MFWKLLRRIRVAWWRWLELANSCYSKYQCRLANGRLVIGQDVTFFVPVRIDGAGTVQLGDSNRLGYRQAPRQGDGEIVLQARKPRAGISIGNRNWFSNNVTLIACAEITIGDDCLIGDGVTVFDTDFHELNPDMRHGKESDAAPVHISSNVWIGSRALVLKGVVIGSGSVVAPMSVVTRDVPTNCIVAGAPARVVRRLD